MGNEAHELIEAKPIFNRQREGTQWGIWYTPPSTGLFARLFAQFLDITDSATNILCSQTYSTFEAQHSLKRQEWAPHRDTLAMSRC